MDGVDERYVRKLVETWLDEDVGRGDRTTEAVVPPDAWGRGRIEVREAATLAGVDVARLCFEVAAPGAIAWRPATHDGRRVAPGEVAARLKGPLRAILAAERTALNALARLSGVATATSRFVDAVAGTPARIVDTRKTTPGLRVLEKYAVRCGGGRNHRFGLDDGILVKDNHAAAAGGVGEAVVRARSAAPHGLVVEAEVGDLEQLDEALAAGADAVLLDNMSPEDVRRAVARAGGKVIVEVSGGIDLRNVRLYAQAGVDLVSIGALTHSAPAIDLALELEV